MVATAAKILPGVLLHELATAITFTVSSAEDNELKIGKHMAGSLFPLRGAQAVWLLLPPTVQNL